MSEIIVDDTDSRIQYTNSVSGQGWFQDHGSQDSAGNYGPTYNHTLHGTKTNGSFSFSFQGDSVSAYGTNSRINTTTGLDPSWECFVDNINIGVNLYTSLSVENNWLLCWQQVLSDGHHQLTVQVTSHTGQPFWFDFIRYRPSSTVSEPIASILIQRWDQAISFGDGWAAYGTIANYTSKQGSELRYNFTGIGISWVGLIPSDFPRNRSIATYSIDDGPSTSFNLNGLPPDPNAGTVYEQSFFSVSELSPGPHSLHVVYGGNAQQTPLTISYMILTNSTLPSPTSSLNSNTPSVTSPISNKPATTGGSPPTDAIIGGVVGGVVALALALLLFFLRRRGQKRASQTLTLSLAQPEMTPFRAHYESDPRPTHAPGPSDGTPQAPLRKSGNNQGTSQPNINADGNPVAPLSNVIHRDSGARYPQDDVTDTLPPIYSAT